LSLSRLPAHRTPLARHLHAAMPRSNRASGTRLQPPLASTRQPQPPLLRFSPPLAITVVVGHSHSRRRRPVPAAAPPRTSTRPRPCNHRILGHLPPAAVKGIRASEVTPGSRDGRARPKQLERKGESPAAVFPASRARCRRLARAAARRDATWVGGGSG
jgi:hypothetical protein